MPLIPTYQQQTSVGGGFQGGSANPDAMGAGIGQSLERVSQGAERVAVTGAYLKKAQDERDAMSYAGMAASQATLDSITSLQQQKEKADPGAAGFTPKVLANYDAYSSQLLDNAPTPLAKQYLAAHIKNLRTSIGEQALGFEAQARIGLRIDNAQTATENAAKVVQQLPEQYGTQLDNLRQTMPDVGPEGKIKLDNAAVQALTNAAASHWLDANPYTVRDATSKALGENGATGKTGVPWVDDASPTQVKTWNNAALVKIKQIEDIIRTTTTRQNAHADGSAAYQSIIGTTPALPRNIGAPELPAFDQKRIDQVSSFVKSPSPYDDAINAAAQKYGVDPKEIKLKIAIESGGNPQAVSNKGAVGLGQFMPATATQYGITDRTDPNQSIEGIAKMLAANGGTAGSDMTKADRAYIGKGPVADQYVENTRAVRQNLIGSGTMPQLSTAQLEFSEEAVLDRARSIAEQRRPGDAVYRDQVVSEAHANWAKALQAQRGQDYGNFTNVLGATIKTGATSISDLPVDAQQTIAKLSPQNFLGIQAQFERNIRQANGEYTKSDSKLVNDLTQRIYLPDGDPNKITYPGQLSSFMGHGLNFADHERLKKEIADANNPETNPFLKQVAGVKDTARKMLTGSMSAVAVAHPELADEAAYRFAFDLDNKVKALRAAKGDPQSLLTPGSKDYVLDPSRVGAFMPTEAQIVKAKVRAGELTNLPAPGAAPGAAASVAPTPVQPRMPGESPAAYLARIGK